MTDGDEAPLKQPADVPPWPRAPEFGLREESRSPCRRLRRQWVWDGPRYRGRGGGLPSRWARLNPGHRGGLLRPGSAEPPDPSDCLYQPDGSYVTRGDANRQPDSTLLRLEQVVGVGRMLVPLVGLPLVWYWAGAWGGLAVWAAGMLLALWLARYALLEKYDLRAQSEESGHVLG